MKVLAALATILTLAPCAGRAADGPSGIYAALDLTSDYRFQGSSNTDGNAAVQGVLHYFRPDGWYLGVFGSQVDFKDPGKTSYELDFYGGKRFALEGGRSELKLQAMRSVFPDNATPGPTYDFWTFQASARRTWGPLALNVLGAFVPQGSYHSGKVWRVESEVDYVVSPNLSLHAIVGDQWGGRNHTRAYWSVGPQLSWKALQLDLRYVGTDRTRETCPFLPKSCDPALVATVTASHAFVF